MVPIIEYDYILLLGYSVSHKGYNLTRFTKKTLLRCCCLWHNISMKWVPGGPFSDAHAGIIAPTLCSRNPGADIVENTTQENDIQVK